MTKKIYISVKTMLSASIDERGNIETQLNHPVRFGLRDLGRVIGHFISPDGDCRIHEIEFDDHSEARIVTDAHGDVLDVRGRSIQITITADHRALIDRLA